LSLANEKEVVERTLLFVPNVPIAKVFNSEGRVIGCAALTLVNGAIEARLFLDKHTPEAFELENSPGKARIDVTGSLFDAKLALTVLFK
jgi:hypothetical protein